MDSPALCKMKKIELPGPLMLNYYAKQPVLEVEEYSSALHSIIY